MKLTKCPRTVVDLCESLGPDDGISPAEEARLARNARARQRHGQRGRHRACQYSKQARQAFEAALVCDVGDADVRALVVIEVRPARGCAVLEVTVGCEASEIEILEEMHGRLTAHAGVLRAAIAAGTHRKRVASLRFRVVPLVR